MSDKLYRSTDGKMMGGVCAGLADYFRIDVTLIRLLWVVTILAQGAGLLAYIIAWIAIPESPHADYNPREALTGEDGDKRDLRRKQFIGIALIVLGVVFITERFWHLSIDRLWPLALVGLGGYLLITSVRGNNR